MRSKEEMRAIIEEARELEIPEIIVDGVTYNLERKTLAVELKKFVEELKPEEIVKPMSTLDELSDEEVIYWASPYFDEIQAKKEAHKNQKQLDDSLRQSH